MSGDAREGTGQHLRPSHVQKDFGDPEMKKKMMMKITTRQSVLDQPARSASSEGHSRTGSPPVSFQKIVFPSLMM